MLTVAAGAVLFGLGAASNLLLQKRDQARNRNPRRGLMAHRHLPLARSGDSAPAEKEGLSTDTAEAVLSRSVPVAVLGLGSALAGLAAPMLALPSVLITGYLTVPFLRDGLRKWRRNRHVVDLSDAVIMPALVLFGQYVAASLVLACISVSRRVLAGTYERSRRDLVSVFGELPRRVWVQHEGTEIAIDYRDLREGDVVVVDAGEIVPVDGLVVDGEGLIDQHMLTGESIPVEKWVGDRLLATTMVLSGKFRVRVERSGTATHASEITRLILHAADRRLEVQERGEMIAERSLPFMVALAAVAGIMGGLVRAIAVFMVTPGYTMRLLAPLALMQALRHGADSGLLIKDGRSLELLRGVDTVVFDKTGTLTDGSLRVARVAAEPGFDGAEVLAWAAAAEGRQVHPIAQALRAAAEPHRLEALSSDEAAYTVGRGIRARIDGRVILVGSRSFLSESGVGVSDGVAETMAKLGGEGLTSILVAVDGVCAGLIGLDQVLRPEARRSVAALRARGFRTLIISGDNAEATRHLAVRCGVDDFHADTLPGEKAAIVEALQAEGRRVCFIGDGINDAVALKQADVSISIRGAASIAVDTAQIVLLTPDLGLLVKVLEISDRYERVTGFASKLAITLPALSLPFVFFGQGGVILVMAGHQAALWTGLGRILVGDEPRASTPASGARTRLGPPSQK